MSLNANDHSPLLLDGDPIEASASVTVPEPAAGHGHGMTEFEASDPLPTVALDIFEDAKSGYNVHVETTDFTFAPDEVERGRTPCPAKATPTSTSTGRSSTRLYGEWYHLDVDLDPGDHEIRVELNANDHSAYVVDGEPIEADRTITVAGDDAGDTTQRQPTAADEVIEVSVNGGEVDGWRSHEDRARRHRHPARHQRRRRRDPPPRLRPVGRRRCAATRPTSTFEATIPGVFEVEFEQSGLLLVELEIS